MSGFVGNLSEKQEATLSELRKMVAPLPYQELMDDPYLLRFLRARNFHLEKAFAMLSNHFEWRKQYGADTLVAQWTPPSMLNTYYPGGLHSVDKEGSVIYIDRLGQVDPRGILRSVKKEDFIKFRVMNMERTFDVFREASKTAGRKVEELTCIMDLNGLGRKHLWKRGINLFAEIAQLYEAQYPEIVKKVFIVNAPRIFPVLYNIIKPFLNEVTRQKVRILGSDYKTILLEHIDASELPRFLGGACTCSGDDDIYCRKQIRPGGEVPSSFFLDQALEVSDTSTKHVEEGDVGRSSAMDVPVLITRPGSVLRYEFITKDYDIKFGVLFFEDSAAVADALQAEKQPGPPEQSPSSSAKHAHHGTTHHRKKQGHHKHRTHAHGHHEAASSSSSSLHDEHEDAAAASQSPYIPYEGSIPKELEEVVEVAQHESHLVMSSDEVICEKSGVYVLRWDNTYSWTRGKHVKYSIEVNEPDTQISEPQTATAATASD